MNYVQDFTGLLDYWIHLTWVRELSSLLLIGLVALLPATLLGSILRRRQAQHDPSQQSRPFQIATELLVTSLWPGSALLVYFGFVAWVNYLFEPPWEPQRILPILLFLLAYRLLSQSLRLLLPPSKSRRVIRKLLLPTALALLLLQLLGLLGPLLEFLRRPLVTIGGAGISLLSVATSALLLTGFVMGARQVTRLLLQRVWPRLGIEPKSGKSLATLIQYALITLGGFVALDSLGFDLSTLKIVLGALGVGIGFGLQNIVNNFVSGIILLAERKLKHGDVVSVAGVEGKISDIGLRSSVVVTRGGHEIIVPNGDLVTSQVSNLSLHDHLIRLELPVGVSYDADPRQVRGLLLEVAQGQAGVLKEPEPRVLFTQFGASSIDFELRAWCDDPWGADGIRSELYYGIWYALKRAAIEIPFPQQDLHLRSGPWTLAAPMLPPPPPAENRSPAEVVPPLLPMEDVQAAPPDPAPPPETPTPAADEERAQILRELQGRSVAQCLD